MPGKTCFTLGRLEERKGKVSVSESRGPLQCFKGSSLPEGGASTRVLPYPRIHPPLPGRCLVPLTILPSPSQDIKQIRFPNAEWGGLLAR